MRLSAERNKARALELIDRLLNGHDVEALHEYTSNPAVICSGSSFVRAFPDCESDVRWAVADEDMVVVFFAVGVHSADRGYSSRNRRAGASRRR